MRYGMLVGAVVFGVLLMHSVAPSTLAASPGEHAAMGASMNAPADGTNPEARGEHDCPSGHQMMHPCMGVTTSWQALTVSTVILGPVAQPPTPIDPGGGTYLSRAPPWSLQGLDKSVTLRV